MFSLPVLYVLCISYPPSSEPMWPIEARNAAIANTYFVGANNRVGTVKRLLNIIISNYALEE